MQEYLLPLKVLGNSTRLRILRLLLDTKEEELCVCEIVDVLAESQFNISRHLRRLEKAGLAASRKKGKWVMYRLQENPDSFRLFLSRAVGEIPAEHFAQDTRRLRERLALRVEGECVVGVRYSDRCSPGEN